MRIAVAMSGGVDSLVAAHLLQRDGHDIFGVHFLTGFEALTRVDQAPNAERLLKKRIAAIRRMVERLGIPLEVIDLSEVFHSTVAAYLIDTYGEGRTPNPCMVCNPEIKLGHLWRAARVNGAQALATGHYAIIRPDPDGRPGLFRGVDPSKDQSYFLARATTKQLARTVFPLGRWRKPDVRALARENNLQPAVTAESQDICFIQDASYAAFMARHGGDPGQPGPIHDVNGMQVGTHPGLHHFTVGQRRGINVPASAPYYVVRIDRNTNRLIVGGKADLEVDRCQVTAINWIAPPPLSPIAATVKVRYRSPEIPAEVTPTGDARADVAFETPVAAVTPGQGAVFYDGDRVLGGGCISSDTPR